jgi:hypothetical protein
MLISRHEETVGPQGVPQWFFLLVEFLSRLGPTASIAPDDTGRNWLTRGKVGLPKQMDAPSLLLGACKEPKVCNLARHLVPLDAVPQGTWWLGSGGGLQAVSWVSTVGRADDEDAWDLITSALQASLGALDACGSFDATLIPSVHKNKPARPTFAYPFSPLPAGDAGFGPTWDSDHGDDCCSSDFASQKGANSDWIGNGESLKLWWPMAESRDCV